MSVSPWLVPTSNQRTNLHALVCRQQLQTKLVRREHLPTLIPNDMANRSLRAEILLAMHNVYPETRERAMQRFRGRRVPFLFLLGTRRS